MEKEKQKESVEQYISSIVRPIFEKAAKETVQNPMMVGSAVSDKERYCLYNPHNYRLYYDFSKEDFKPLTVPKSTVWGLLLVEHKLINKIEHSYNNFMGCRVTVKKYTVEVINKIDVQRWYRIPLHIDKIKESIAEIIRKKDRECIVVLRNFIKIYGGKSRFHILNRRSEDKIKNEDMIDLVPLKQNWHNKVVKKVYNEKNVEFSDAAFASNYLRSRALEDKADSFDKKMDRIAKNLDYVAENYKSHAALVKQISKLTKTLNKRLGQSKLKEFF